MDKLWDSKLDRMVIDLSEACNMYCVVIYINPNSEKIGIRSTFKTMQETKDIINIASDSINNKLKQHDTIKESHKNQG